MLFVMPALFVGVSISHHQTFTSSFMILPTVIVVPITAAAAFRFIAVR
jgi:hypothetical protein